MKKPESSSHHIPIPILYRGDVTIRKIDNGFLVSHTNLIHYCKNLREVNDYLKLVYRITDNKKEKT